MIEHRPFTTLGQFSNDWLRARYHFSFSGYHDPNRMGWGPLRVWNDDAIHSYTGFDPHGHRDMEIITYVRQGAITHQDSLGNTGRTEAGDVQVMSAGTGITHAEYNREDQETRLFQIWIFPDRAGHAPYWQTRKFPRDESADRLVPLASGRPDDLAQGALPIHQDATLLGATLAAGTTVSHDLTGRLGYVVVARGQAVISGPDGIETVLDERDGAAIRDEDRLTIRALQQSEILLADLPR